MKYTKVIIFILLIYHHTTSIAQVKTDKIPMEEHMRYSRDKRFNKWDFMIGYGLNIIKDDFSDYLILPKSNWHYSPFASLSYQIVPALAFDIRGMYGDLYTSSINHYYKGDFYQVTGNARFYINQMISKPGPLIDKWNFYFKVGFGYHAFRNKIYQTSTDDLLQYNDVEGMDGDEYFVIGYDQINPDIKKARQIELTMPFGIGILYRLNRSFDLGMESTINYGLEDNLDGVLLGATNDNYWYTSFNLSYKIGKKDKRHSKWTYRSYNFNILGAKKKDPLEEEINKFERILKQQEGILRLQIDTTITIENDTKIYTADDVYPIYFMPGGETFKDYENQITIAQIAVLLREHKDWKLNVVGHADNSDTRPEIISQKRADAVKYYFTEHYGIEENRLNATGRGTENQLTHNTQNNAPDRINIDKRVDIEIIRPRPNEVDTSFRVE